MDLDQLMSLNLMRHNTREEVINEVDISLSHRRAKRFERKEENGKTLIRACFCRNFEEASAIILLIDLGFAPYW